MDVYQIAITPDNVMMVNGAVCRWDDYDYVDPDYHRQRAMDAAWQYFIGSSPFTDEKTLMRKSRALSDVVQYLHINAFELYFGTSVGEPTADVLRRIRIDIELCINSLLDNTGETF